jgi:hypothetical protein
MLASLNFLTSRFPSNLRHFITRGLDLSTTQSASNMVRDVYQVRTVLRNHIRWLANRSHQHQQRSGKKITPGLPPSFWEGKDLHGDSSTATVMGMASGYDLKVYKRFVGTLRKRGYNGHIILGVAPDVGEDVKKYFEYRNVIIKILKWEDCSYRTDETDAKDIFKKTTCAHPYPEIKIHWSRFPLARDWLKACKTSTGPFLITDVRDTFFQMDPFGPGSPVVKGLQVFEEHKNQTTKHWLTSHPFEQRKAIQIEKTMLCSGTTVGTRVAMLQYLQDMYDKMKLWIDDPNVASILTATTRVSTIISITLEDYHMLQPSRIDWAA